MHEPYASASGDLHLALRRSWDLPITLSAMFDSLADVGPALLTLIAAAIFALMLWAGSRVH